MKIEIWSDYVCPFCYMGKTRLEQALEDFPHKDQVAIEFKSYELEPNNAGQQNKHISEGMAEKFNISIEEAQKMNEQMAGQVKEVGLPYNSRDMTPANTFDAHRLAKYAEKHGKGIDMTNRLFTAYFSDGAVLSDHDALSSIAREAGFDETDVREILESNKFAQKVKADQLTADEIGVKGVPFFVFNEEYALSGGQTKAAFTEVLETVWKEEQEKPSLKSLDPDPSKTTYCSGSDCETQS